MDVELAGNLPTKLDMLAVYRMKEITISNNKEFDRFRLHHQSRHHVLSAWWKKQTKQNKATVRLYITL